MRGKSLGDWEEKCTCQSDPAIQRSNDPAIQQKASVRRLVAFEDTGACSVK